MDALTPADIKRCLANGHVVVMGSDMTNLLHEAGRVDGSVMVGAVRPPSVDEHGRVLEPEHVSVASFKDGKLRYLVGFYARTRGLSYRFSNEYMRRRVVTEALALLG